MLNAGTLTFEEFAMREELPLATIHEAVLDFLRGRDDAVVFGAQARQHAIQDYGATRIAWNQKSQGYDG